MKRVFDPEAIRAQIGNLLADRDRIDFAITSLQEALRAVEQLEAGQREFQLHPSGVDVTLQGAVKRACAGMIDGITRQRVIGAIEREHPFLKPKSPSVAASLINLTKGDNPMLRIAIEGQGRSPSFYSTEGDTVVRLSGDEIKELFDEKAIKGTGGWQSLWVALLRNFDKAKGEIRLTPELRARMYQYYHSYGVGGWQDRMKRVFRRELPHLFAA